MSVKKKTSSSIQFKQDRTNLLIILPNKEEFSIKLSVRIFRKYQKTVINYLDELLSEDESFTEYYVNVLSSCLRNNDIRYVLNIEFIKKLKSFVDSWFEKNKHRFITSLDKNKTLNHEQLISLFKFSFYLKLVSPFMYTSLTLEEEKKLLFKILAKEIIDNGVNDFLFEFVRLKFLKRMSRTFWSWLTQNKFQDISYHIVNSYYTVIFQILLQLVEGFNPLAYIKSVVEQTLYYLYTDIYVEEVKYGDQEIKKIRFVKNYSLIQKHVVKATYEQMTNTVISTLGRVNIRPEYNIKPIYQYITLPLCTKLLNIPYFYFFNIKDPHYLNLYISLLLEYIVPHLTTLRQVCKSYCMINEIKYRLTNQVSLSVAPLYDIPHMLQSVFNSSKCFDQVVKKLLTYKYIDIMTDDEVKISNNQFISELVLYYEHFLLGDKYHLILNSIRSDGFDITRFSSSFLKLSIGK